MTHRTWLIYDRYRSFFAIFIGVVSLLASASLVFAQATAQPTAQPTATTTPEGNTIEISGVVTEIRTDLIVVAGLTVDVSAVTLDANITVGVSVTVKGRLLPTNIVLAESVIVVNTTATPTTATPTAIPTLQATPLVTPTPTSDVIVVVEGPIQNINVNIITIYNINISIEVNNPILNIIQIGDVIYVEGVMGADGVIVATVVNNLTDDDVVAEDASVGIQGAIEAINGNLVTVNGITVQFDPNDPQLANLVVGNFLDVQGNFVFINNVYVLVVVNVVIINDIDINVGVPEYCWWHDDGMGMGMGMGHWHCDGMGMGPGPGMGMGMGMGG